MHGFLLINKPRGITSFDVVRQVRKTLNMRKVGHAGTLDPLATGLMIIALGEGTKLLEYLLKADKTYLAEITFGSLSDTYDAEGKLTSISDKKISLQDIQTALPTFQGKISQIPPKYSALKINGKKACDLARQGKKVEIKSRTVEIFENKILNYTYPKLNLKINCGTGTYIRSIAHDLGQHLAVGGYLTHLERTQIGNYKLEEAIELKEISPHTILPIEWGTEQLTKIELNSSEYKKLKNGLQIPYREKLQHNQTVACLYDNKLTSICKYLPTHKLQPVKNLNT